MGCVIHGLGVNTSLVASTTHLTASLHASCWTLTASSWCWCQQHMTTQQTQPHTPTHLLTCFNQLLRSLLLCVPAPASAAGCIDRRLDGRVGASLVLLQSDGVLPYACCVQSGTVCGGRRVKTEGWECHACGELLLSSRRRAAASMGHCMRAAGCMQEVGLI